MNEGPYLTSHNTQTVFRPVSNEDIMDYIFAIKEGKAFAIDGFNSNFFEKTCNMLKMIFITM